MKKMTLNELKKLMNETVVPGAFKPIVLSMNGFEICRGYICGWEITTEQKPMFNLAGKLEYMHQSRQKICLTLHTMDGNRIPLFIEEVVNSEDVNHVKELEDAMNNLNKAVDNYKQYFLGDKNNADECSCLY